MAGVMTLENRTILIKGAGEKASAVAHRLYQAGMKRIVMTDLPAPRAERRGVCFCEAIIDWRKEVMGVMAERAEPSIKIVEKYWILNKIPVIPDPECHVLHLVKPDILVDGVMAKRNTGTAIQDAPLVVALGPGFTTGVDCHAVIETNPASPHLGQVILKGEAEKNTGAPTPVLGLTVERLIRSPADGRLTLHKDIGDVVNKDEIIGSVNGSPVKSPLSGCIWGIVRDGIKVKKGQKIGDIDPRGRREPCFEIAPEARKIAEGVWTAISHFGDEQNPRCVGHNLSSDADDRG